VMAITKWPIPDVMAITKWSIQMTAVRNEQEVFLRPRWFVATAAEDRLSFRRNAHPSLRQPAIAEQLRFMSTRRAPGLRQRFPYRCPH